MHVKTKNSRLALLVALVMLLAQGAMAQPQEPEWMIHEGATAALYRSQEAGSPVLRRVYAGQQLRLASASASGQALVAVELLSETGTLLEGYMAASALRALDQTKGEGLALLAHPEAAAQQLRSRPADSAKSLGLYYNGVHARLLGQAADGWVKVGIGSIEGYLPLEGLSLNPQPQEAVAELPTVSVAYADGPSLTLRAEQNYQSEKLGAYPNGNPMSVLGFTEDFVHVAGPDGKLGFMMAWGVSPQLTAAEVQKAQPAQTTGEPSATAQPQGPAATPPADAVLTSVNNGGGQGAHLRARASANSDSLGLYLNGEQVYLISWGEWWCRVWVDGKTGYMMTKLINVQGPDIGADPVGWNHLPQSAV